MAFSFLYLAVGGWPGTAGRRRCAPAGRSGAPCWCRRGRCCVASGAGRAEVAATFGPVGRPAAFAGDRRTGAAARPREPTLGASSDLRPATQAGLHRLRDERSAASRRCGTVETMLFFRNRRRRHSAHGMRTPI